MAFVRDFDSLVNLPVSPQASDITITTVASSDTHFDEQGSFVYDV